MTLPSSGPLSLNDIKGEFGGPTSPSLGDYYAGGTYVPAGTTGTYGAVPPSGTISIRNFYGTSKALDVLTVTTGTFGTVPDRFRGFSSGIFGSISPTTSAIYGGASVISFFYEEDGSFGNPNYRLAISGATNSGWTQVTIGGTRTLLRASATFLSGEWYWATTDTIISQAFGANGSVRACVFT